MEERFREHYFVLLRITLLLVLEVYILLSQSVLTGASVEMLLLLALFIGIMAGKELVPQKYRILFFIAAIVVMIVMVIDLGKAFLLLGIFLCYEILTVIRPQLMWYFAPILLACVPNEEYVYIQIIVGLLMAIIYIQHDFVVESYRQQTKEDNIVEQHLKRDMYLREHQMQRFGRICCRRKTSYWRRENSFPRRYTTS